MDRSRITALLGLLAVFAIAFVVRALHLHALAQSWEGTQLFSLARGDAAYHWREAQAVLDGNLLLRDVPPWKTPGFSYLWAAVMQIAGREPAVLRWTMAMLGALNCVGITLLARRLVPWRWSLAAGFLVALHGLIVLFDGELYFPPVLTALNLVALLLLTAPRRATWHLLGAGLSFGLAIWVHPVQLLVALAVTVAVPGLRPRALLLGALAITVLPMSLQNIAVRGEAVAFSTSGGINLYIGNHPAFDQHSGQQIAPPTWQRLLDTPQNSGYATQAERDRFFARRALKESLAHPLRSFSLLLQKGALLVSPSEPGNNIRLTELRDASWVLRGLSFVKEGRWWPSLLWIPLLVSGLVLLGVESKEEESARLLLAWCAGMALTLLIAFHTARYRAPLVALGAIAVVYFVRAVWVRVRAGRGRALLPAAGVFVVVLAVGAWVSRPQESLPPPAMWSQAQVDEAEGRTQRAMERLREELSKTPEDPVLRTEWAEFLLRHGRHESAREEYRSILRSPRSDPDLRVHAHAQRARSFAAQRDPEAAVAELEAALALTPDEARFRGVAYYALGLAPVSACALRWQLAQIHQLRGDFVRTAQLAERVLQDCPEMESVVRPARLFLSTQPIRPTP